MGSFFAGVKAGTLAGVLYIGGLVLFNVALLFAFKADALSVISKNYTGICPPVAAANMTSADDCFGWVVSIFPEYLGFAGFFVTLGFSGLFGVYYDSLTGRGPVPKGETAAILVGLSLVLLGIAGVSFTPFVSAALGTFLVAWTFVFGVALGRLYARYTRKVRLEGPAKGEASIMVDGKDFTGRTRTFAVKSVHQLRAEVGGGMSFRGWTVSGGVSVEDQKSFETEMEVNGDGLLKLEVSDKY